MNPYIEMKDINFSIKGKKILNNINLKLYDNEFVSIIGLNGSGKTTIGKIIMGILTPNSGDVIIEKENIKNLELSDIGKKIGYLFQNPDRQIFASTVYDELSFAMKFNKIDHSIIDEKVNKALLDFDLIKIKNSMCHTLSQGEKQRLAISVILLNNPKHLILDEPTKGLDIKRKNNFDKIIETLKEKGISIIMISHDKAFIEKHSDRIIVIENGKITDDKRLRS